MSELININTSEKPIDGEKTKRKQTIKQKFRQDWQLCAKIFELIFCALCLGMVMEPAKRGDLAKIHLDHFALIFPTFIGYLLIVSVFLLARLIGDKIPHRTGFILSVSASCLFFVAGILLAVDRKKQYFHDEFFYEPRPYILRLLAASTAFSFFSSILFGIEALYIWKFREDF